MRMEAWTALAFGLGCASPGATQDRYRTENVVIAVMDGTAWRATFGDPEHRYIPRLWNELKPKGTLYTRFYNDDVTITKAGHSTIATGTWQKTRNRGPRNTRPTIFDYLHDEQNVPREKVWVVFGKGAYAYDPRTSFPSYRSRFEPSSEIGIGESSLQADTDVFQKAVEVMKRDRPRILFVNFGGTDHLAHSGHWDRHVMAIRHQDDLLVKLWETIEDDPHYAGRTALFLTNDHGYHLDGVHEGFAEHGDSCEGCRHIMLLALGPDIREGAVVETPAYQTDIAPTVGELLSFQTPLSDGEVLKSCLRTHLGTNRKEARTETARNAVRIETLARGNLLKHVADRAVEAGRADPTALVPGPGAAMRLWGLLSAYDKTRDSRYLDFVRDWGRRHLGAAGESAPYVGLVLSELSYRISDGPERAEILESALRIAADAAPALEPNREWARGEEPALQTIFLASLGEAARERALWERAHDFLIARFRAFDRAAGAAAAVQLRQAPSGDLVRPEGKVVPTTQPLRARSDPFLFLALAVVRSHGLPFKGEYFEDVPELRAEAILQSFLAVEPLEEPGDIWPSALDAALNIAAIEEMKRRKNPYNDVAQLTEFDLVRLRPDSPELLPRLEEVKLHIGKISATNYNVEYGLPPYRDFDYTVDLLRLRAEEARSDLEIGAFLLALDTERRIPFEPQFNASRE